MAPLTGRPVKRPPAGTRTRNSTLPSLSRVFIRPPLPALHSLGRPSRDGYTAQMVTPPVCSITLISTSSGLLRRARLTPLTSTSPPPAGPAPMPPLTPLTSLVGPPAARPCPWEAAAPRPGGGGSWPVEVGGRGGGGEGGGRDGGVGGGRCFHCPSIHRPPPYRCLLGGMLREGVCTLILAPPPPVLKLSSFSLVHLWERGAAGPRSFSMLPLKLETEKSAPMSAGKPSSTEPLTLSACSDALFA